MTAAPCHRGNRAWRELETAPSGARACLAAVRRRPITTPGHAPPGGFPLLRGGAVGCAGPHTATIRPVGARHLRREGLGAGDADFGPRVQVDTRMGLAGDGAAHGVADAEAQAPCGAC
eukprot:scaffold11342_cov114-Isochrysis_galbana.AAC.1